MRYPRLLLTTLVFLFSLSVFLSAQATLELVLKDATTQAPIEDAFVFFSGSSAGGITDAEGKVALPMEEYLELVISHLSYETKVLSAAEVAALNDAAILLTPTAIKIDEVTVTYSGNDAKKRKRRLKRFTSAFLGPKRDRKGVRIRNPEVLLFAEGENGLRAEARDRIQITNDALGYEVSFLLDTFLLTPQQQVFYGGKAFFEDLEKTQPARAAAWQEARRKSFARSKAYFFRQLARKQLNEQRYEIGESRFDRNFEFLGFTPQSPGDLHWQRGLRADTLYYDGFFTVADKRIITKWTSQSARGVVADEYATTFMRSRSSKFVISPGGILLNNQEVEEIGYWADQRVARLLPSTYQAEDLGQRTVPLIARMVDSLETYQRRYPQEKVYLHLDKPMYGLRDHIWFRAYLLDATFHRRQVLSKVVHVELIDPQGKIIRELALHKEQSMHGNFALDSTARAGIYHLRAYTEYMRNGSQEYFFRKEVPIYDPAAIGDGRLRGVDLNPKVRSVPAADQPFQLTVFPEGGTFISGIENTLVLRSQDLRGEPLDMAGTIVDAQKNEIAIWSTSYAGRGLLKFVPEPGKTYHALVTEDGKTYRVPLPEAQQGLLLHVNNLREADVYVKVGSSAEGADAGAMLIGHVRGEVFLRLEEVPLNEEMAFPRSQIQQGVVTLSLFSAAGQLLAERLFFNDYAEEQPELKVEVPYAFFRPRQRVRLELSWADSLFEQGAILSAAVTDRAIVQRSASEESIASYLLLNADVPQTIDNAGAFLTDVNQRKRFLADLQLATAAWKRFDWAALLLGPSSAPATAPQYGETLSGYVTPKGKPNERQMAEVILTALHPEPVIAKVLTDESGNFTFTNLPYLDSVNYVLQAARYDPKKYNPDVPMLTSKNRRVDIYFQQRKPAALPAKLPPRTLKLPEALVDNFALVRDRDRQQQEMPGPDWSIDLNEVTVTGERQRNLLIDDVFDLNKIDWIPPQQPVFNMLSTLKPGYRFTRSTTSNELQAEVNNGKGTIIRVPVLISIDGFTASFARFQTLKADMIDYIMIKPTSIAITTRGNLRSAAETESPGMASFRSSGFYPKQRFPAPGYAVFRPDAARPDLRTTIHWEPNLRLEAGQPAVIAFYAADVETEYEVRIEGITDSGEPVVKTVVIRIAE